MDGSVSFHSMRETIGLPAIVGTDAWLMGTKYARTGPYPQPAPLHAGVPDGSRGHNRYSSLLLGQVISMLIAMASMSAASLDDRGVNLPSFVNLITYSFITLAFLVPKMLRSTRLKLPWWRYALYALVDVEGNTMTVLAYRYTSITSVTMLDAFSIPSVMLFSRLFLRARYTKAHLSGVGLCLLGLALTVVSDVRERDSEQDQSRAVEGDLLCILGAALYAGANVMQENFVKNHDRVEFLAMAGLFGVILSGIQTVVMEGHALGQVEWSETTIFFVMGYATSLFVMYSWTSLFLQASDAALFNLSLLTADIYALVFALLVEHKRTNWIYFVAFAVIFTGLCVYHAQPPVTKPEPELPEISESNSLTATDMSRRGGESGRRDGERLGGNTCCSSSSFREIENVGDSANRVASQSDHDLAGIVWARSAASSTHV